MIECETKTRKWGNSIGLILPKEVTKSEKIKENEKLKILILKQNHMLKKTFGMFKGKWKKSAQTIKDEIRAELHNA